MRWSGHLPNISSSAHMNELFHSLFKTPTQCVVVSPFETSRRVLEAQELESALSITPQPSGHSPWLEALPRPADGMMVGM